MPSQAAHVELNFADLAVPATVYTFVAPRSATGQDAVEFHLPGNPLLAKLLIEELLRLGVRQAEPGEFTARAYFNGKLDLTQAEAVASLVSAENAAELTAARKLLGGEIARRLSPITDALTQTLALLEAGIDFSEEDVHFITADELMERLTALDASLTALLEQSIRLDALGHEPTIVLVGKPNAGKSSLLNALAGHKRALVSPIAGTTRDVLSATLALPRGRVRLIDVAGIELADDELSRRMQRQARDALESADVVVQLRDCTDEEPFDPPRQPHLRLASKIDLGGRAADGELPISVHQPATIDALRERLDALAFGRAYAGDALALNARHRRAMESARAAVRTAIASSGGNATELIAADLRRALNDLGDVLGQVTPDDVLGQVFATFCIGK